MAAFRTLPPGTGQTGIHPETDVQNQIWPVVTALFKRPIKSVYIRELAFIDAVNSGTMKCLEYPVIVSQLPLEESGGVLATVPDLPGCMSDGETPQETIINVQDAITELIEAAGDLGYEVSVPSRRLALA